MSEISMFFFSAPVQHWDISKIMTLFVVTLFPLGYFDIDFLLYVWRYKDKKYLSNILIYFDIEY